MLKFGAFTRENARYNIPGNTFIFDPESYYVYNGALEVTSYSEFKSGKYLGYFLVGLAVISLIVGLITGSADKGLFTVLLLGFFFCAGLGLVLIQLNRGNEYFNQRGKITVGQLISIEGKSVEIEQTEGNITFYQIIARYSFYGPGHQTQIVGKTICKRDDLENQFLPLPGTPVVVLYINPQKFQVC